MRIQGHYEMKSLNRIVRNMLLYNPLSFLLPLILLSLVCTGDVHAIELKTAAQESAPKYFKNENNSMTGLCIDIIRAIERTDPEIKFSGYNQFLPFNRLQKQLEDGDLDVFLGFKKTPARLNKFHFVEIPLYQLDYKLAMLAGSGISEAQIENMNDFGPEIRVLTVRGTAAASFLRDQQSEFIIDESAYSPAKMILMLKRGRAPLAFYHDLGLLFVMNSMDHEKSVQLSNHSYSNYFHYLAFSRKVPPETVEKVTKALQKLKGEGTLDRISRQYKLLYQDQAQGQPEEVE